MTADRKFAQGRYRKQSRFYLDHDGSKYVNTFGVLDGDKDTGISVTDSGDSSVERSNKRSIVFRDQEYPLLRDAIFAYEDEPRPTQNPGSPLAQQRHKTNAIK